MWCSTKGQSRALVICFSPAIFLIWKKFIALDLVFGGEISEALEHHHLSLNKLDLVSAMPTWIFLVSLSLDFP